MNTHCTPHCEHVFVAAYSSLLPHPWLSKCGPRSATVERRANPKLCTQSVSGSTDSSGVSGFEPVLGVPKNCGKRPHQGDTDWDSMYFAPKHRASFSTKWSPNSGSVPSTGWMIHMSPTTSGQAWTCTPPKGRDHSIPRHFTSVRPWMQWQSKCNY